MRYLKYFSTKAEYEEALANNELPVPRVIVFKNNDDYSSVYRPLKEFFLLIDEQEQCYLGTDAKTLIAL